MPSYQITTDKGTYQVDTEGGATPSASTPSMSAPGGDSNMSSDLGQASSALSDIGNASAPISSAGPTQSPGDAMIGMAGQFGKAAYSNPIVHPALKALSDWTGSHAEEAYGGLGDPQGIGQQIASGIGSALPLMGVAGPMGEMIGAGAGALAGATKGIPILGKMTGLLGDSQLAKSALTGLTYGASEALAQNAQGGQVDVGKSATDTAGQFLLWSALAKGGASLGAKFIPKGLLNQPDALKNAPLVGQATKNFFTPEGLGSIAGGALAGALSAPDNKTGIAGAIVGSALSAMNPSEQYQFRQGMGKSLGFKGISSITDHFGKPFAEANDLFEKFGFDDVTKAGNLQVQQPNEVGGQDTLATPQIVAKLHLDALNGEGQDDKNSIKAQKSALFDQALQKNINISPKSLDSFTSLLRQRVNQIQDPTSPVVRAFNKTYDSLIGLRGDQVVNDMIAEKISNGEIKNAKGVDPTSLYQQMSPQMREALIRQSQAKNGGNNSIQKVDLNGLHQLKMDMQEMVSPQVWAGEKAMSPEERDASGIAKQISQYIGKSNPEYAEASKQYRIFKNIQGKAYGLDATKLSQNMLTFDETKRNIRENELNQISKYLVDNGKQAYDSRNLLRKYYAYQIYNNPTSAGFAKSYPVREVSTAALAGLLHFAGVPGGALIGGLAGWNMSNPAAWLPVLKGASIGRQAKS